MRKNAIGLRDACMIPVDLLQELLPNSPSLAKYATKLKELEAQLKKRQFSVNVLMECLESPGNMKESPTPAGLDGELRPFQKQALHWMLEQERNAKGISSHLWIDLPLFPNKKTYYSPLLGEFAHSLPKSSTGGFLCEEMGLGKTVESLALIPVSYTHLRAHETVLDLVCRLLLEKKTQLITEDQTTVTNSHDTNIINRYPGIDV
eukprot:TRINITY_DN11336_c0_g1_i1.p1 TRINITY_DN11336_c0_g1~~TRINITY_DN11336_c0_g1_i1.p1  ORF type:complete len:205 (+),score=55.75 TRINITY_DN11336_c0_g1_i1:3-617(+)